MTCPHTRPMSGVSTPPWILQDRAPEAVEQAIYNWQMNDGPCPYCNPVLIPELSTEGLKVYTCTDEDVVEEDVALRMPRKNAQRVRAKPRRRGWLRRLLGWP